MAEYLTFGVALGALVLSYLLAGTIDSRLQIRHREVHDRLGNLMDARPLNQDSIPRALRWFRFLLYEHYREGDVVLSGLCVSSILLVIGAGTSIASFL